MSIGENIVKLRSKKGLTQTKLAELVVVSRPYLAQIERGTKSLPMPIGVKLAEVLECSLDDLVRG